VSRPAADPVPSGNGDARARCHGDASGRTVDLTVFPAPTTPGAIMVDMQVIGRRPCARLRTAVHNLPL
jgi:hypothetical protein